MSPHPFAILLTCFLLFGPVPAFARELRIEAGSAETASNYFEVPRDAGTRVDLPEGERDFYWRVQGTWDFAERHALRVLIAPLEASYELTPASPVRFQDATFAAGRPLAVDYKFNSYRASYIYTWRTEGAFVPHAGATAKIRDASIRLEGDGQSSTRANVGFVPLLNLGFDWLFKGPWSLAFDLDGLAARQGRAFDGKLELDYTWDESWTAGIGYRVLDGGVDSDENVNFAQFRFVFASLARRL